MTRFCWWTLVWFGLWIVSETLRIHTVGGWAAFKAEYDETTRAGAAVLMLALWFLCWFYIVKREP